MTGNRIKQKIIKIILILFVFSLSTFYSVKAEAFSNVDEKKIIQLNKQGKAVISIFNEGDGFWAPGFEKNKSFYLQNNSTDKCMLNKIKFQISLKDAQGNAITSASDRYKKFVDAMNGTLVCDGKILFSGKISDCIKVDTDFKNEVAIDSRSNIKMDLTFSMNSDADDSLKNLTGSIDISFLFNSLDGSSLADSFTKKGQLVDSLIQTGSIIDTKVLIILGIAFIALGGFIIIKKRKND